MSIHINMYIRRFGEKTPNRPRLYAPPGTEPFRIIAIVVMIIVSMITIIITITTTMTSNITMGLYRLQNDCACISPVI